MAIRSKISLTNEFRMAIALFEIPVSGWTCLRTGCASDGGDLVATTATHPCRCRKSRSPCASSCASSSPRRLPQTVQTWTPSSSPPSRPWLAPWTRWTRVPFRQSMRAWGPLRMCVGGGWVAGGRDVAVGGKDGKRRERRAAGLYTDATRLSSFVQGRGPLLMRINKSRLALARDRPAVYISGARDDRCFSSTSISPRRAQHNFSDFTHPPPQHTSQCLAKSAERAARLVARLARPTLARRSPARPRLVRGFNTSGLAMSDSPLRSPVSGRSCAPSVEEGQLRPACWRRRAW